MHKLKTNISQFLAQKYNLSENDLYSSLDYPPDKKMGDLSLPCFKLAKSLRRSPQAIAEMFVCDFFCEGIEHVESVNGYFNLYISNEYLSKSLLDDILNQGEKYGSSDIGEKKNIVIDYSSPNVAKPFHLGHLGTTVIGHSLKNLFEFNGYNCIGINHLGDWGTSMGKQIAAYKLWGNRELIEEKGVDGLVELYIKFHEVAENDEKYFDMARNEFTKLENGDEENTELWKWFISISLEEFKIMYKQLDIVFDHYIGESFFSDKMTSQIEKLREKELLKVDDGATIVDLSEYNMPPCIILKRDGSTLYHTRDIASAVYRHDTFNFDRVLYVTAAGQNLYFKQLFKVLEMMGYDWADKLVHISYGTMSFGGSKLGTRGGNSIWLKQLINMSIEKVREIMKEKNPNLVNFDETAEAVGVGAIVYYYLSNGRIKDIDFKFEDALNFDGNTGPYVQYSYARACSVLEKAKNSNIDFEIGRISELQERELLLTLALFPEKIKNAVSEYEPSVITRYIYELASSFNRFYHECQILNCSDSKTAAFRIRLTEAVKIVLGKAFELICMKKTERI